MPKRVLFICTGNSARSIMAEVILNSLGRGDFIAQSAGAQPSGTVNPLTIEILKSHGHTSSGLYSKALTQFLDQPFDHVITVCDSARQSCPIWPGKTNMLHWSISDPAEALGSYEGKRAFFDGIYRDIEARIREFIKSAIGQ